MGWRNEEDYWGRTARLLHWVIALFIFAAMISGFIILNLVPEVDWHRTWWQTLMPLHKSFGIIALALSVARVLWAIAERTPRAPESLTPFERVSAKAAHYSLYVLILIVPLTGWASSSAVGAPTRVFDLIPIPFLVEKTKANADFFYSAHEYLSYLITAIVLAHTGAALWHHFVKRDDVLMKIIKG